MLFFSLLQAMWFGVQFVLGFTRLAFSEVFHKNFLAFYQEQKSQIPWLDGEFRYIKLLSLGIISKLEAFILLPLVILPGRTRSSVVLSVSVLTIC